MYSISKGVSTILENWEGINENGKIKDSFNHYSYGSIVGWLFDRPCGIVAEDGTILLALYPGKRLGYAKATYDSSLGSIVSAWRYEGESIGFDFYVPAGHSAEIRLPNGEVYLVEAGEYQYVMRNGMKR